jgi:hypothetical protein
LMRWCVQTHFFPFFFYLSKYNIVTKPTDYYEKTIIKLLISSWMHAFRILNIKAI